MEETVDEETGSATARKVIRGKTGRGKWSSARIGRQTKRRRNGHHEIEHRAESRPETEPTRMGTEPTTMETEPTRMGTEPTTMETEPTTMGTEPTTTGTEPTITGTEPTTMETAATTVEETRATAEEDWKADLVIPPSWIDVSGSSLDLRLCTVAYQETESSPPLVVTRSLVVSYSCRTWQVHIHGHLVDPSIISTLAEIPPKLDGNTTSLLLQRLSKLNACSGNPETNFTALAKAKKSGQFLSTNKAVVAYLDASACVTANGKVYPVTVRCSKCHLLTAEVRCQECHKYRNVLCARCSCALQDSPAQKSKKINYRFLKTPERLSALWKARQSLRNRDRRLSTVKKQLDLLTSESGVQVQSEVQEEISKVIERHGTDMTSLPVTDFRRMFWDQQVAALNAKTRTAVRWHPLFVRWCLNLSRVSPKAYEIIRESGMQLPTRRTLMTTHTGCLLSMDSTMTWIRC